MYISWHILPCTQNCHLNANSTHCAGGKSSPYFWLALHRTKVRWRFCIMLWPSQNIWTLFSADLEVSQKIMTFALCISQVNSSIIILLELNSFSSKNSQGPLFSWCCYSLDARKKIRNFFCWFFGKFKDITISFWNFVTFRMHHVKLFAMVK